MTNSEHTYVRDKPYIPSTTSLCEGIKNDFPQDVESRVGYLQQLLQ